MSKENELIKNTIILSLGKFLPKLTAFITLPILTACLTKAEYGTYDLLGTLIMLVIPIATLQIQSAAFRFLIDCRGNQEESTKIISNIFIVTIPITLLASIGIGFYFRDLGIQNSLLIVVYFIVDTIYMTVGQIVRGKGYNIPYAIASVANSVLSMIFIVLFLKVKNMGLFGLILSLTIAYLICIVYLFKSSEIIGCCKISSISKETIKELIGYSWPMVPNNLSAWVLKLSDRLVITYFLGVEATAIYAVSNKIPNLLSMAQGVMVMAWSENASIAVNDSDAKEYYSKMFDKVIDLMFSCTALLIATTPIMFYVLIRGDYAEAYYQIPMLIFAMFFYVMSSFLGGIYIAHKKTKNVGVTTMVAAAINLGIDLILVNSIGIWAASISTLVAYFVLYIYRMMNCQKFQPIKINHIKNIIEYVLLIIMLLICFQNTMWLNVLNILFSVFLVCVLEGKELLAIFGNILRKGNKRGNKR